MSHIVGWAVLFVVQWIAITVIAFLSGYDQDYTQKRQSSNTAFGMTVIIIMIEMVLFYVVNYVVS